MGPDPGGRDEAELRQPREPVHGAGLGRRPAPRPSAASLLEVEESVVPGPDEDTARVRRGPKRVSFHLPARERREVDGLEGLEGRPAPRLDGAVRGRGHEDRTPGRVRRDLKIVHEEIVGANAPDELRPGKAPDGNRLVVGRRGEMTPRGKEGRNAVRVDRLGANDSRTSRRARRAFRPGPPRRPCAPPDRAREPRAAPSRPRPAPRAGTPRTRRRRGAGGPVSERGRRRAPRRPSRRSRRRPQMRRRRLPAATPSSRDGRPRGAWDGPGPTRGRSSSRARRTSPAARR